MNMNCTGKLFVRHGLTSFGTAGGLLKCENCFQVFQSEALVVEHHFNSRQKERDERIKVSGALSSWSVWCGQTLVSRLKTSVFHSKQQRKSFFGFRLERQLSKACLGFACTVHVHAWVLIMSGRTPYWNLECYPRNRRTFDFGSLTPNCKNAVTSLLFGDR